MAVDASDVGAGSVLLQDDNGVDHPVCFFSKMLSNIREVAFISHPCSSAL